MLVVVLRWLLLIFFANFCSLSYSANEIRVVCYYTNWSVYRPGTAKFSPQNINPYLCTHLIYAFGGFTKENTLKPFDKYQDIEKGGYAKFTGLKTYNKNLKTMLAIGGWNEGSSRFSPMVASSERRRELVKNVIKFLRQYHFDGLDLDWEYPSFRDGGKPRDKENYAHFVQELREEFEREFEKTGRPRLLLTMAVPAGIEYINKGYDVPKLTKYLDWMNILSYDYHSAFEPAVNHHAPLYPTENDTEYSYEVDLNIDYTIKHYLKVGAEREKLVLGIPTYGRSYTLFNPDANEIGSPADGPGSMGDATRENGYLAFYEICDNIKKENWTVQTPYPDVMGPYAYKDNQWVGYDDEDISRKKARYVIENNLGGIMFWSIDNDDFRGNCYGKPYPLIEAAKEELFSVFKSSDKSKATTAKTVIARNKGRRKPVSANKIVKESDNAQPTSREPTLRRNRLRINQRKNLQNTEPRHKKERVSESRRRPASTTPTFTTPSYTTPAPPTTPDTGSDFKCEDEGFFPHPRDCKKYFWCLNGASDTGIVAHQFTCPAGLYFNKAADSCDYSQNVLCNKKRSKASTTTAATTKKTSTLQVTYKTTQIPKISTTTTTTTEAIEYDDEEYEYDDDGEEIDSKDPQVIKELLDLIKKAGGIEELEKQLQSNQDDVGSSDFTTKSTTLPRKLYESVLHRVSEKTNNLRRTTPKYTSLNRNRGYQNTEPLEETAKTTARGRPQYTYITRKQFAGQIDQSDQNDEDVVAAVSQAESPVTEKSEQKEYVTIRRNRFRNSPGENSPNIGRAKELAESVEKTTPKYVTIRRRPSTDATTTVQYTNEDLESFTLLNREKTKPDDVSKISNDDSSLIDDIVLTDNNSNALKLESTTPKTQKESSTVTDESYADTTSSSIRNVYETNTEAIVTTEKQAQRARPNFLSQRKIKPLVAPQSRLRTTTEAAKVSDPVSSKYKFTTEINEESRPRRGRGKSRFVQASASTTSRTYRSRPILTTEAYDEGDQKQNRKYRPDISVEVADLSSLTAADISTIRNKNSRRRIRLSTTSENPRNNNNNKVTDALGSYSKNVNQKISRPSVDSSTTRQIVRQYETSSANPAGNEVIRKRILRRYRPTSRPESTSFYPEIGTNKRSRFSPKRNTTIVVDSDGNNTITNDVRDEPDAKSSEEEDIKLSESIIRESNDVGGGVNNNVNTNLDNKRRQKVIKRFRVSGAKGDFVTEPNVVVRTRKIIRKLLPTTEKNAPSETVVDIVTTESSTESIESITEKTDKGVFVRFGYPQNYNNASYEPNSNVEAAQNVSEPGTSTEVTPEIISTTLKINRGRLSAIEQRRRRIRPKTPTNYLILIDAEKDNTTENTLEEAALFGKFNAKRKNVGVEKKESRKTTTPKTVTRFKPTKHSRNHFVPRQFRTSTTEHTTERLATLGAKKYIFDTTKISSDVTTLAELSETTTLQENCNRNGSDCADVTTNFYETTTEGVTETDPSLIDVSTTITDSIMTESFTAESFSTEPSPTELLSTESISTELSSAESSSTESFPAESSSSTVSPSTDFSDLTTSLLLLLNETTTDIDGLNRTTSTNENVTLQSIRSRFKNFPANVNTTKSLLNRSRPTTTSTSTTVATRKIKNYRKKGNKRRYNNSITSTSKVAKEISSSTPVYESKTTSVSTPEVVTEQITTLHHVFAETEKLSPESSTETYNENTTDIPKRSEGTTKKTEKLIEVSRIVEVHSSNDTSNVNNTVDGDNKHLDKIGAVSRVTVIKIVDGLNKTVSENDTLNNEVRPELNQTERRTPVYIATTENVDKSTPPNAEVTLKPNFATEASTIALEGLFLENKGQSQENKGRSQENKEPSPEDKGLSQENKEPKLRTLEILTPPRSSMGLGDMMMQAEIVEITPKNLQTIKIVPITFQKVLEPVRKA